jgi:hypothetical protein
MLLPVNQPSGSQFRQQNDPNNEKMPRHLLGMLPPQLPPATLLLLLCWHLRALTGVSRARVLQDIKVHPSIKRNGRGSSAVESESVVR